MKLLTSPKVTLAVATIIATLTLMAGRASADLTIDRPSPMDGALPISSVCTPIANARPEQYLQGKACPPPGFEERFGYEPLVSKTNDGPRAFRLTGECSWLSDTGATYDFQLPCKTHDYGYDLRRAGVITDRKAVDDFFLADMHADGAKRGELQTLTDQQDQAVYDAVRTFGH